MWRFIILLLPFVAVANTLKVGSNERFKTIKMAISSANPGDTILVYKGIYKEKNLDIDKPLVLIGIDRPVLDGEFKNEILSFRASNITLKGFKIMNSGQDEVKNIGALRLYDSEYSTIEDNIFENNYFGITIQRGYKVLVKNNKIYGRESQSQEKTGNGIHAWASREIVIEGNYLTNNKDGIYLEKVTKSTISKNTSKRNLRYGLHFMFANDNHYYKNIFDHNEAGVAVMYSNNVDMTENHFMNNWGDGSYGILLKDISFGMIKHNYFENNTTAIFMDGATKLDFNENIFSNNGWGLKINASSMENRFAFNSFKGNTFDVSTNSHFGTSTFKENYWDKYEGYDLNKDNIGDVPYHPLSLYSVLVENYPAIMLLFRSFLVDLLEKTEKVIPSLTPENFVDEKPLMKPLV